MVDLNALLQKKSFSKEDLMLFLSLKDDEAKKLLNKALEVKLREIGNKVYLRGLIEYSNVCRKNCYYCGVRLSNNNVCRYSLSNEEVLDCAKRAMQLNYGSIAIQCGERQDRNFIENINTLIKQIKKLSNNSLGITLSCGEQEKEVYEKWFSSGAHRYLLRIETTNEELFYKIHPKDEKHSFQKRIRAIEDLIEIGYQTGTGVMIGLPFQEDEDLANDLLFFKKMNVAMVGMGPFIPHNETPLYKYKDIILSDRQRLNKTLNMIASLRLLMPKINMVAATADQSISEKGREEAVLAGANIIMPNLTPRKYRENYSIYPNKASLGDIPIEGENSLDKRMLSINHSIGYGFWGDSKAYTTQNEYKARQ
ncbi:MAG: [FeFe] hydrogenase H-cluster radical SAM maturase HydE [Bacteroidales bacterium]|jgi:biotin synthase|nr:[FeFe] hydrogenase H-cluster radical SAM maturase HydE [Bacteroidales bacterium]